MEESNSSIQSTSSKSSSKKTNFQFTYDADNYLLDLIYRNREDIFTRGNKLRTWKHILTQFNSRFDSGIVQTRTISHRFQNLIANLEKKLIHVPSMLEPGLLNENETILMEIVELMIKTNSGISFTLADLVKKVYRPTESHSHDSGTNSEVRISPTPNPRAAPTPVPTTIHQNHFNTINGYEEQLRLAETANNYVQLKSQKPLQQQHNNAQIPDQPMLIRGKSHEFHGCRDQYIPDPSIRPPEHNHNNIQVLESSSSYKDRSSSNGSIERNMYYSTHREEPHVQHSSSTGRNPDPRSMMSHDQEIFSKFLLLRNEYNAQMNNIKLEIRQLRNEIDFKVKKIEDSIAVSNDSMDEKLANFYELLMAKRDWNHRIDRMSEPNENRNIEQNFGATSS
ncbi:uncharacterized protein SPAPADRAFT_51591 [Spathaspora passalidarum NRRL Y-27907]|uniref:Uncharacterized protein n=1 Tax=Spathaspora passalidarum (strain NRRL Y-27907 / 11-Y1) TaxID=619300 RepID=G3AQQ0_SPAPN|nr:uncharacterized protein SPAPADRAFT_51591 [Spathaspora passalidarum NRRL Y-27907]EGW31597.1 hypothetical protein SPAPADRAFT_51591 [Spathaspora passalidarum NRRL Y-27907]